MVKEVKGVEINDAFPRMTYKEAMRRYGSDKPDTRFEMELIDVSQLGRDMDFKVFKDTVENDGEIKAIVAKGAAEQYTRKDMDALTEFVNIYGAKGLAWVKVVEDGLTGQLDVSLKQKMLKHYLH